MIDDADVGDVVTGAAGVLAGLRGGGVIAVPTTVHPDSRRRLADLARARDVTLIDAPVSGGGQAAAEGRLVLMAGGEPGTVAYCRPVFAAYAESVVVHMGPLGTGQVADLFDNVLLTADRAYCRPVFAAYADPVVVHMGPLGTGQVAELLDNVLFPANLAKGRRHPGPRPPPRRRPRGPGPRRLPRQRHQLRPGPGDLPSTASPPTRGPCCARTSGC